MGWSAAPDREFCGVLSSTWFGRVSVRRPLTRQLVSGGLPQGVRAKNRFFPQWVRAKGFYIYIYIYDSVFLYSAKGCVHRKKTSTKSLAINPRRADCVKLLAPLQSTRSPPCKWSPVTGRVPVRAHVNLGLGKSRGLWRQKFHG